MKKSLICLLCVFALLFSGCLEATGASEEKIVIKVVYPLSRGMGEKDLRSLSEWFRENYPDAELDLTTANVTTITGTVQSALHGGDGPDVFVITDYDLFYQEGLLAEVSDLEAATYYRNSITNAMERDGKLYALPIGGGNLIALHYNPALFEQYGLEAPRDDETFTDLVRRIQAVIEEEELDQEAVSVSLLYPSQVALLYKMFYLELTQTMDFLKWDNSDSDFNDPVFLEYLKKIQETIPKNARLVSSSAFETSTSSAIEHFLAGESFMYLGEVPRCYETMKSSGIDTSRFKVTGVPCGLQDVRYVAYMDDLYLCLSSTYSSCSPRKQKILADLLNFITTGSSEVRNIFTFTGDYTSVYLKSETLQTNSDVYFDDINACIQHNYVEQGNVGNDSSTVFGKTLIAWNKGQLSRYTESEGDDLEQVLSILNASKEGENPFVASDEVIAQNSMLMEYNSDLVRGRETQLGNQVADMARSYMHADFALINAGCVRASIPDGNVTVGTIASVLPYSNYLVKIRVSGKTLKKALINGYDIGPNYGPGKFALISGLRVRLTVPQNSYDAYADRLAAFDAANPDADVLDRLNEQRMIVNDLCAVDPNYFNYQLLDVTDENGAPIEDDKIYTVATLDYLLKDQDGYDMLGILSQSEEADRSIEIYDRSDMPINGTVEDLPDLIQQRCMMGSDGFTQWLKNGGQLNSQLDGRITIENFIDLN